MKKWVCTVLRFMFTRERMHLRNVHSAVFPASKFKEQASEGMAWGIEHEVGVAQGFPLKIS